MENTYLSPLWLLQLFSIGLRNLHSDAISNLSTTPLAMTLLPVGWVWLRKFSINHQRLNTLCRTAYAQSMETTPLRPCPFLPTNSSTSVKQSITWKARLWDGGSLNLCRFLQSMKITSVARATTQRYYRLKNPYTAMLFVRRGSWEEKGKPE